MNFLQAHMFLEKLVGVLECSTFSIDGQAEICQSGTSIHAFDFFWEIFVIDQLAIVLVAPAV